MSRDISLRFYNSHTLGKGGSLEEIVALFKRENFLIYDITIRDGIGRDFHWDLYEPNEQSILTTAYQRSGIDFRCSKDVGQYELSVYLGWAKTDDIHPSDTFLAITTFQTALFTRQENNPAHFSKLFLKIGTLLYQIANPDFGWIDMESMAGFTLNEDIASLSIPYTYWANFLGERYLKKYGREKLLRTPVWHSERLNPDGVLLVLSSILGVHPGDTGLLNNYLHNTVDPFIE